MKKFKSVFIPISAFLVVLFLFTRCSEQPVKENVVEIEVEHEISEESVNDMGMQPWVFDIEDTTVNNANYRTVIWSGKYIQLVLMSLKPGEKVDLELHNGHDQFMRIEKGEARVLMGKDKDNLTFDSKAYDDFAILIPAGYWHEIINIGNTDLKLYTIYGPPEHLSGIVHSSYEEAQNYEH